MDILKEINAEPKTASFGIRLASATIDFFSLWFVGFLMGLLFGKLDTTQDGFHVSVSGFPALILFVFWFALIPISEGLTGQTAGKRICKIIVVRRNLEPTNIGISLLRHLFDVFDFCCLFIGSFLLL